MKAYVVRELVSVASGEKDFRTHYEYGVFDTYEAANQCAIATHNPSCFPQNEETFGHGSIDDPQGLLIGVHKTAISGTTDS